VRMLGKLDMADTRCSAALTAAKPLTLNIPPESRDGSALL
jgi:hypothetical protein